MRPIYFAVLLSIIPLSCKSSKKNSQPKEVVDAPSEIASPYLFQGYSKEKSKLEGICFVPDFSLNQEGFLVIPPLPTSASQSSLAEYTKSLNEISKVEDLVEYSQNDRSSVQYLFDPDLLEYAKAKSASVNWEKLLEQATFDESFRSTNFTQALFIKTNLLNLSLTKRQDRIRQINWVLTKSGKEIIEYAKTLSQDPTIQADHINSRCGTHYVAGLTYGRKLELANHMNLKNPANAIRFKTRWNRGRLLSRDLARKCLSKEVDGQIQAESMLLRMQSLPLSIGEKFNDKQVLSAKSSVDSASNLEKLFDSYECGELSWKSQELYGYVFFVPQFHRNWMYFQKFLLKFTHPSIHELLYRGERIENVSQSILSPYIADQMNDEDEDVNLGFQAIDIRPYDPSLLASFGVPLASKLSSSNAYFETFEKVLNTLALYPKERISLGDEGTVARDELITFGKKIHRLLFKCKSDCEGLRKEINSANKFYLDSLAARVKKSIMKEGGNLFPEYCRAYGERALSQGKQSPWAQTMAAFAESLGNKAEIDGKNIMNYQLDSNNIDDPSFQLALNNFCQSINSSRSETINIGNFSQDFQRIDLDPTVFTGLIQRVTGLELTNTSELSLSKFLDLMLLMPDLRSLQLNNMKIESLDPILSLRYLSSVTLEGISMREESARDLINVLLESTVSEVNIRPPFPLEPDVNRLTLDFSAYWRTLKANPNRRGNFQRLKVYDKTAVVIENIHGFFGLRLSEDGKVCEVDAASRDEVVKLMPSELYLELALDPTLPSSACCRKTVEACQEVFRSIVPGDRNKVIVCDTVCRG